jgi:hypothetical protein
MAGTAQTSRRMGQRKLKTSRLPLWRGPEINEVHHVCGGDCIDEVESFSNGFGILHGIPPALLLASPL